MRGLRALTLSALRDLWETRTVLQTKPMTWYGNASSCVRIAWLTLTLSEFAYIRDTRRIMFKVENVFQSKGSIVGILQHFFKVVPTIDRYSFIPLGGNRHCES